MQTWSSATSTYIYIDVRWVATNTTTVSQTRSTMSTYECFVRLDGKPDGPHCGKEFRHQESLIEHIANTHWVDGMTPQADPDADYGQTYYWVCSECGLRLETTWRALNHRREAHSIRGERNFVSPFIESKGDSNVSNTKQTIKSEAVVAALQENLAQLLGKLDERVSGWQQDLDTFEETVRAAQEKYFSDTAALWADTEEHLIDERGNLLRKDGNAVVWPQPPGTKFKSTLKDNILNTERDRKIYEKALNDRIAFYSAATETVEMSAQEWDALFFTI